MAMMWKRALLERRRTSRGVAGAAAPMFHVMTATFRCRGHAAIAVAVFAGVRQLVEREVAIEEEHGEEEEDEKACERNAEDGR